MPARRAQGLAAALALAAVTLAGVSRAQPDDLRTKAQRFRDALVERHLAPEGVLLYQMSLKTGKRDLERGSYPSLADVPTFTGILAATSCLQAELGDAADQARADAERALRGLEALMEVTGVPGLLARGLRRDGNSGPRGRWYRGGPGYEAYRWRGDASADQYANGLLPAVAACAALFPERSGELVARFVEHLEAHDRQLVDPDGTRTRFGDLGRFSGWGFNSIFQLTAYAAYALDAELNGNERSAERQRELRDRERVVARGRVTNLRILGITNHSNDMMSFHLYRVLIPLARRTGDPALVDLRHGLWRSWLRVRRDRNAYFTAIFCALEPQSCEAEPLAQARALLRDFPLDKRRDAPPEALAAVPRAWLPGRKLRPLARRWVPIELRPPSSFEWKSSPYRLDYRVRPFHVYTGLDYMSAYWTLRAADQIRSGRPVPGLAGPGPGAR